MMQAVRSRLGYITQRRTARVVEGSPVFTGSNTAAVAAGAIFQVDFTAQNRTKKWLPFDAIEVVNESDNPVDLIINDGEPMRIPAFGVKGMADIAVRRLTVVNNGGDAIPIGELSYTTFRSALSEMVKRQVQPGTEV